MADGPTGGGFDGGRAGEGGEGGVVGEAFGVVAGSNEQDRGDIGSDTFSGPQGGVGLGDQFVETVAELVEFVAEGLVAAGQASKRELGGLDGVRDLTGSDPGTALDGGLEPLPGEGLADLVGSGEDQVLELTGHPGAGVAGGSERHPDRPDRFDDSVAALGCDGRIAVEGGSGSSLGVHGVVLAPAPSGLTVRAADLHNLDVFAGEVASKPGAVASRPFDSHLDELAEATHPAQQPPVARGCRWPRRHVEDPAGLVHDGGDVEVLVGIHAAVDPGPRLGHAGRRLPCSSVGIGTTGRDGGQDTQGGLARLLSGHVRPTGRCASPIEAKPTDQEQGTGPVTARDRSRPDRRPAHHECHGGDVGVGERAG